MPRMTKDLLLVGSVPLPSVEEVFTACCSEVGDYLPCVPDGEVGPRLHWVGYLYRLYDRHPDIERQPIPPEMLSDFDDRYKRVMVAAGAGDSPIITTHLTVRDGVERIRFERLGYAEPAKQSYDAFRRLRDAGTIPSGMRFQVAIPLTNSAIGNYFRRARDWPIVCEAYEEVARRELAEIVEAVPAEDLAIQWDVCGEILDVDGYWPWWPTEDKIADNVATLARLGLEDLPEEAWLGYHICYGTLGGWPMQKPESVASSVVLANALVAATPRRTDFIHIPAGRKAFDAAYFAALEDLNIGDAKLYLGLIHDTEDGLDDFRKRLAAAGAHADGFGLASVCGYGRCNPEELAHALAVHRAVMEDVAGG